MTPGGRSLAHGSLVVLWWGTVVASLHDGSAQGVRVLQQATGMDAGAALALVRVGCIWDATLGLWLWRRPGRCAYRTAAAGVIGMTLVATWLVPSLWLDPFGPLLKNLPVLALLALLDWEAPTP